MLRLPLLNVYSVLFKTCSNGFFEPLGRLLGLDRISKVAFVVATLLLLTTVADDAHAQRRRGKHGKSYRAHGKHSGKHVGKQSRPAASKRGHRHFGTEHVYRTGPHSPWQNSAGVTIGQQDFPYGIRRGVNLSHWLSQSRRRGQERLNYLTKDDISWIATHGMDHVRLPVDEEQLWLPSGQRNDTAFALAHAAVGWCLEAGLKVVLDLHIIKSHHFNETNNTLWTNTKDQEHLADLWRDLSRSFRHYPNSQLAYEFMNEPVAPEASQWNALIKLVHGAIRAEEPERWLVIGSNRWQSPATFGELEVPEGDRNIMLSLHFYEPMWLTHHQAQWVSYLKEYKGKVNYPGLLVNWADTAQMSEALKLSLKADNKIWDERQLDDFLDLALAKSKKLGLPLYCGEWGCYEKAPMPQRLRWYLDMRRVLERHHIPWTVWDYKGSFGIRRANGDPVQELLVVIFDQPIQRK